MLYAIQSKDMAASGWSQDKKTPRLGVNNSPYGRDQYVGALTVQLLPSPLTHRIN